MSHFASHAWRATFSAVAAKAATTNIPVVFTTGGDPVQLGLVASLARPGGNVTGPSMMNTEIIGKRMQLLKEVVPGLARVAVLTNAGGLGILAGDHLKAASELGVPLVAIGLFYRRGYFRQRLNADGYQEERFPRLDTHGLALTPTGVQVSVEIADDIARRGSTPLIVAGALVLVQRPTGRPTIWSAVKVASRSVLMGIPVMVALFVLFPRLGPLWSVPADAGQHTGLSDKIRLGNVAELAQDDSVAMRIKFDGKPPPQYAMYFRGPVLSRFDGSEWRALQPAFTAAQLYYSLVAREAEHELIPECRADDLGVGALEHRGEAAVRALDLLLVHHVGVRDARDFRTVHP